MWTIHTFKTNKNNQDIIYPIFDESVNNGGHGGSGFSQGRNVCKATLSALLIHEVQKQTITNPTACWVLLYSIIYWCAFGWLFVLDAFSFCDNLYSFIHFPAAYSSSEWRVAGAHPSSSVCQAGATLDRMLSYRKRAPTHPHSLTIGQCRHASSPNFGIALGWGRKPEYPEKTYADMGRTRTHRWWLQPGIDFFFFFSSMLWQNNVECNEVIWGPAVVGDRTCGVGGEKAEGTRTHFQVPWLHQLSECWWWPGHQWPHGPEDSPAQSPWGWCLNLCLLPPECLCPFPFCSLPFCCWVAQCYFQKMEKRNKVDRSITRLTDFAKWDLHPSRREYCSSTLLLTVTSRKKKFTG